MKENYLIKKILSAKDSSLNKIQSINPRMSLLFDISFRVSKDYWKEAFIVITILIITYKVTMNIMQNNNMIDSTFSKYNQNNERQDTFQKKKEEMNVRSKIFDIIEEIDMRREFPPSYLITVRLLENLIEDGYISGYPNNWTDFDTALNAVLDQISSNSLLDRDFKIAFGINYEYGVRNYLIKYLCLNNNIIPDTPKTKPEVKNPGVR
jgi:hypothetical protein